MLESTDNYNVRYSIIIIIIIIIRI